MADPLSVAHATIKIVIELDPATRRISAAANVADPVIINGLLEEAKEIFREVRRRQLVPQVELAPPGARVVGPNGGK